MTDNASCKAATSEGQPLNCTVASHRDGRWPLIAWIVLFLLKLGVLIALQIQYDIIHYLAPDRIGDTVDFLQTSIASTGAWGPALIIVTFALSMVATFPFFPVVLVCLLSYGWLRGIPLVIATAGLGLTLMYVLGQWLGRPALRKIFGESLDRVNAKVKDRELMSVVTAVLIFYLNPIASWALCVSEVRYRNLMLGTLIGAAPGIFLQAWLVSILLQWGEHGGSTEISEYPQLFFRLIAGLGLLLLIRAWLPNRLKRFRGESQ